MGRGIDTILYKNNNLKDESAEGLFDEEEEEEWSDVEVGDDENCG